MNAHCKTHRFLPVALAGLIMAASPAVAADKRPAPNLPSACARVVNLPFPAADRPTPADLRKLDKCSAYDLYYGFNGPADPAKARLCAFAEMDDPDEDGPFNGEAMLMTIYANGVGARRNFDLALKLACKIGGAPEEIESRIRHLTELKAQNWQGHNFSLCDDISDGYMVAFCAGHTNKFAGAQRDLKLAKIQSKWNGATKKQFALLRKAATRYFKTHTAREVDQTGTRRTALVIDETVAQEEYFVRTLEMLEQGKLPQYSVKQGQEAETKLSDIYRQIQKTFPSGSGTVTREGIKQTQRAWFKYREAWVKFGAKKYPACSPGSIRTFWTMKRIRELEEFIR